MLDKDKIAFIEANRHHYDLWVKAQFIQHLDYTTRDGLLNIAREFDPGYLANLWCSPCVADLLTFVYKQYDKWKKTNEPIG